MENVMNFLAENYIYFFVAAGILLFALLGFLVDSKKKKDKEFKGEEVKPGETAIAQTLSTPLDNSSLANPDNLNALEEDLNSNLQNIAEVNTINQTPAIEQTMEINDIPMVMPEEVIIEETPVNPELQNVANNDLGNEQNANENLNAANEEIETFEIFDDLN